MEAKMTYASTSTSASAKRWFSSFILAGIADTVSITYNRGGNSANKTLRRFPYVDMNSMYGKLWYAQEKWEIVGQDYAYFNLGALADEDRDNVFKTIPKILRCNSLIFDLGSGSWLGALFYKYLFPERRPMRIVLHPDQKYPGKFVWNKIQYVAPQHGDTNDYFVGGKW